MRIQPITLKEANYFVYENHRTHGAVQGHKFSIGCYLDNQLIGVAICGRPVSRRLDNGLTLEVTRLCTTGTQNACSKLYGACARIAKEMGYNKIITYINTSETGVSLKASGWELEQENCGGVNWSVPSRERLDVVSDLFAVKPKYPKLKKNRYCKVLQVTPAENRNQ